MHSITYFHVFVLQRKQWMLTSMDKSNLEDGSCFQKKSNQSSFKVKQCIPVLKVIPKTCQGQTMLFSRSVYVVFRFKPKKPIHAVLQKKYFYINNIICSFQENAYRSY